MILPTTSQSIELVTGAALSTDYAAFFIDHASGSATPGNNVNNVATATTTTIVSAPGSSVQRQISMLTVKNKHASSNQTARFQVNNGGTIYRLTPTIALLPSEVLQYVDGRFVVMDERMVQERAALGKCMQSFCSTFGWAASTSGTHSHTSGVTYAQYIGQACVRGTTSVQVRYTVATALGGSVTWGEIAIAKGPPLWMRTPTLTVIGYADVTGVANSTGRKTTTVNLSSGQVIEEGDHLWFLAGSTATTPMVLRSHASTGLDPVDVNYHVSQSVRPSTIDRIPYAFQTLQSGAPHSVAVFIN